VTKSRKISLIALGVGVLALILWGVGGGIVGLVQGLAANSDQSERSENGEISAEGKLGVLRFQVGDCLNNLYLDSEGKETEVATTTGVPCSDPHTFEVYHTVVLEDSTLQEIQSAAMPLCQEEFQKFVGLPLLETTLDIATFYPLDASYAAGDREIVCVVSRLDGGLVEGSLRGSGDEVRSSARSAKVGVCFNASLVVVPCNQPHVYESFHIVTSDATTLEQLDAESSELCFEGFESYLGVPYEDSIYFYSAFIPTEQGFLEGDRVIDCRVHSEFFELMIGSVQADFS
jgi:hypothetical protein